MSARAAVLSEGPAGQACTRKLIYMVAVQIQSPQGCCPESLNSSLPAGGEHPDSCHVGFSNMGAYFIEPATVSASKTEILTCCKLILKVRSHHLCHIVLAATMLLSPDRTGGERATQWHEYEDAGIIAGHLRSLPST